MSLHVATRRALLSRQQVAAAVSDFVPTDLVDLAVWYDPSDAATMYVDAGSTPVSSDGDSVFRIDDKSGNSFFADRAVVAQLPTYETGEQNGLSILRSTTDNNRMLATHTFGSWAEAFCIVVAGKPSGFDASNAHVIDIRGSNSGVLALRTGMDDVFVRSDDATSDTAANSWSIGVAQISAVNCLAGVFSSYVNGGTAEASGNFSAGNGLLGVNELNLFSSSGGDNMLGDIFEVVVCDAALSTADLNSLGNYLGTKWNLTWTTVT